MSAFPAYEVVADDLGFPEGPVVMADGSVIVVEISRGLVTRCWNGRKETVAAPGGGPNGAAIGPDGALYVCNNGGLEVEQIRSAGPASNGRIERIDLSTGRVERIYESCGGHALSGPNDLVFDAAGNIWFTDIGKPRGRSRDLTGLYHCRYDGSAIREVHYPGMSHTGVSYNGVGLSPDGSVVYVADTFQARVYAFAAAEEKPQPRLVATAPGPLGLDSLAVTAVGNVCVGSVFVGGIATVRPDGHVSIVETTPEDERYVTNIAFGGSDLRDAYVTFSGSGRLVRTRWPEPGLALNFSA